MHKSSHSAAAAGTCMAEAASLTKKRVLPSMEVQVSSFCIIWFTFLFRLLRFRLTETWLLLILNGWISSFRGLGWMWRSTSQAQVLMWPETKWPRRVSQAGGQVEENLVKAKIRWRRIRYLQDEGRWSETCTYPYRLRLSHQITWRIFVSHVLCPCREEVRCTVQIYDPPKELCTGSWIHERWLPFYLWWW